MPKVLGISGSPHKDGNFDTLLKHILSGAASGGAFTEAINLCDYSFQGCIGCEKCRKQKDAPASRTICNSSIPR